MYDTTDIVKDNQSLIPLICFNVRKQTGFLIKVPLCPQFSRTKDTIVAYPTSPSNVF